VFVCGLFQAVSQLVLGCYIYTRTRDKNGLINQRPTDRFETHTVHHTFTTSTHAPHGARLLDGPAVEEELLGERRLAGVRV
jgi:hypothetical protein